MPEFLKKFIRPLYYKTKNFPMIEKFHPMSKDELIEGLTKVTRVSAEIDYAALIIVMSDILKEAVIRAGADGEKITVLGNRVDTSLFKPVFIRDRKREKYIELLFVGRQEPQKNLHNVILAMKILISRGYKVKLNIVGGGRKTLYTRSLLTRDIKSCCKFWGAVRNSDLPGLYNAVDMLVNPSFFEGFQIPLIEALACGIPVVTSNREPGNKIISEETGALVNPDDPEDIARGILSVKNRLNNFRKRLEIMTNCRIEAITKWDYYLISKKETGLYERVLEKNE
jgi:glycosyltransferase involved in cell wall biosynthesis